MTAPRFPVVGVAGQAGHGKGAAGAHLVQKHGFRQVALADPLKLQLAEWFPPSQFPEFALNRQNARDRDPLVRRAQQIVGTEVFRARDPQHWVKLLSMTVSSLMNVPTVPGVVVTDVRFPGDEAQAIKDWGGLLLFVERPGFEEKNIDHEHASESEVWRIREMAHAVIVNGGTLEQLRGKVTDKLTKYLIEGCWGFA